jgi:hypothetical protein
MKRLIVAVVLFCIAILHTSSVNAQSDSVTGTWTVSVEHVGMQLTLRQEKDTVTGTLTWPHGDPLRLTGRFAGDTLTFAGDSRGDNFTVHVHSTGRLQADGTMAGVFKTHFVDLNDAHEVVRQMDQEIPWTATRVQQGTN